MRDLAILSVQVTVLLATPRSAWPQDAPPGGVLPPALQPHRIAVVRRPGCATYESVLEEIRGNVRAIVHLLSVEPNDPLDPLPRLTRLRPDLVLAVGQTAYDSVRRWKMTPLLHTLAHPVGEPSHVAVVEEIPPRTVLSVLRRAQPSISHVALLHGPRTATLAQRAADEAVAMGLTLLPMQASSPAASIRLLRRMDGRVQALWLAADIDLLTPQVLQYALALQFRRHVLLMGASCRQARHGALLAMDHQPNDIGQSAARLVNRFLSDAREELRPDRREPRLCVNRTTARNLGIPPSAFADARAELVD